ncbi:hypothetical protein RSOLAG1IB_08449 [Rhizoctonia solani AG-1 IB]|uniref:CHAT domain-containing protein n=1 Tax=Thanatephorus cucumeris (strain AG1-IB / isolate 7/3/14) TaxID=1108050 RepID=A0A0B7FM44_THACB|nr:hypothetical protein RSOLAG1IB_08449 [Rhizoctonia solani AG-1 IB]
MEKVARKTSTDAALAQCLQHLTKLAGVADALFESSKNPWYLDVTIGCETQAVELVQNNHPILPNLLRNLILSHEVRFQTLQQIENIDSAIVFCGKALLLASDESPDLFSLLNKLGGLHFIRFSRLGEPANINRVIDYYTKGISILNADSPLMYSQLNRLGMAYKAAFQRLGKIEYINQAIDCLTRALSLITQGDPNKPLVLSNLGSSARSRFEITGNLGDLSDAIKYQIQATTMIPDGHPMKPALINNLGSSFLSQFERLGELEILDKAISSLNRAVLLISENNASTPRLLCNLGKALRLRFRQTRRVGDIKQSIEYLNRAIKNIPEDHPELATLLSNLGLSYLARFESLDNLEDINFAIEHQTRSLQVSPKDHPDVTRFLSNLGSSHMSRFNRLGIPEDLDQVIKFQEQAAKLIESISDNSDNFRSCQILNNLGTAYRSRYEHRGEIRDLDKAIHHLSNATACLPDGNPITPNVLSNLGVAYRFRFGHIGNLEDISQSIKYQAEALLQTPRGHPDRAKQLSNTGSAYQTRFHRLGKLEDINQAIELLTLAALLISDDHPEMPILLSNLGSSHQSLFRINGRLETINSAIECLKEGLSHIPDNHPRLAFVLETLGDAYVTRFVHIGNLEDADSAIKFQSRAAAALPQGHTGIPRLFSSLGGTYQSRFGRLHESDDIEKALYFLNQAVSLSPDNHIDRSLYISSLGTAYHVRYQVFGTTKDIDSAIQYQAQAASLYPLDHPDTPAVLSSLGISYRSRFNQRKRPEDIEEAIKYQSQAVALGAAYNYSHASTPGRLTNLSISYQARFGYTNKKEDGDKSIELLVQAVALLPEFHADLPRLLNSLGHAYLTQPTSASEISPSTNALKCFEKSATLSFGYPRPRFNAARNWARIASESSGVNDNSLQAYQKAIELVPQIVWLGSTIEQRYNDVGPIGELAVEAAAAAIFVQRHELALEWLEQGRSVVWNQILKLRAPLGDLSAVNPSLARQLEMIANELHATGSRVDVIFYDKPPANESSLEEVSQRHRRLAEDYELLINQAQKMPGCQNLLRPKEASLLMEAAQDGPIVVINIYKSRCDALLIRPNQGGLTHIALPKLSHIKVVEAQANMETLLQSHGVRKREQFRRPWQEEKDDVIRFNRFAQILEDLWVQLVEPVVKTLGILHASITNDHHLPHITWCTTGPLSFLPIHAAGYYTTPGPKLYELAISSYTLNLASLLSATRSLDNSPPKILLVGQHATPGQSQLPGTKKELYNIRKHVQENFKCTQLEGSTATTEAVLTAMDQHEWVHLACHAHQNINNPTESGLFLQDGVLDIKRISQNAFCNKQLAFLSACQTATGDKILADETVHMASGLLTAGYPTVVATMWSVMDADAPLVADRFYEILLNNPNPNHKQAAKALHASVRLLRETVGEEQFVRWLPYVHFGI